MNKELIELLLDYIDAKIEDKISEHMDYQHKDSYYYNSNASWEIKKEIYKLLGED